MSREVYLDTYTGRKPVVVLGPLLRKIQKAIRPTLREPDLKANLEVADFINQKQGASSRDACVTLVKLINCRDTPVAILAVSLLNTLVRNCGYPVRLQVSRKEFLNQLVCRFPAHPPPHYSQLLRLILRAIEEWYQTFAKHGEYKREMSYIRDMHRLLSYKGYTFPKLDAKEIAMLQPKKQLKTVREIQQERDVNQAAKLEELVRRGTPQDLAEANQLMKVMAGFKQDNIIFAKQVVNHELNKLKHKADIFDEMLSQTQHISVDKGDTVTELYFALKSAYPKFSQLIEEEEEDEKLVQNLTSFKYYVNQLLEKYEMIKSGQLSGNTSSRIDQTASQVPPSDTETAKSTSQQELNLLDFDSEPSPAPSLDPFSSNGQITPMSESLSFDGNVKNNSTTDDLIDLLGDLSNVSISTAPNTVQNFGMNNVIQLDSSANANVETSVKTVEGLSISNMPDLLSGSTATHNDLPAISISSDPVSLTSAPSIPVLVHESRDLNLHFALSKPAESSVQIEALFSNVSDQHIKDMKFSLAAPKLLKLQMEPQSSDRIASNTKDGMKQIATIMNVDTASTKPLRVKWKIQYTKENDNVMCEEGAVFALPQF